MQSSLKCLRPCLSPNLRPASSAASSAYLRFYSAAQSRVEPTLRIKKDAEASISAPESYPRIIKQKAAIDHQTFHERYRHLTRGETSPDEVVVRGTL